MSDYTQSTFFAPKDLLATGNPNKIIYGSDVDAELSAISTAIATKADVNGDAIGAGTPCTELSVDNLKLDGNKIISTNTDGDIELEPDGTGSVVITKVDIADGEIDGTPIGANSASTGNFTNLTASAVAINGGAINGVTIGGVSPGAGYFTTLAASGDVNFDSGTFFVDVSTDRVGVGTASPAAGLHVSGNSTMGETTGYFVGESARNNYVRIGADSNRRKSLVFESGGTDRFSMGVGDTDELAETSFFIGSGLSGGSGADLVIDSSGNLLVGATTTPHSEAKVSVSGGGIQYDGYVSFADVSPNGKVFTITGGNNGSSAHLELEVITYEGYRKEVFFFYNNAGTWIGNVRSTVTDGTAPTFTKSANGSTVTVTVASTGTYTPRMVAKMTTNMTVA